MKFEATTLLLILVSIIFLSCATTQNSAVKKTSIIILRHAEKDTVGNDPVLSAAGVQRAARLKAVFPGVNPDYFYSTNTIRTKTTIGPWAKAAGKDILLYDSKDQAAFAELLLKYEGKTIVVAGHSNTISPLVNLLIKEQKYENLADTTYGKIFLVTIEDGKSIDKIIHY